MNTKQLQAETFEIRRQRLLQLRRQYDKLEEFAAVIDVSLNYLYRMLQDNPKGRKNCGEQKARQIEVIFDLQRGWLDRLDGVGPKRATRPPWPFVTVPMKLWDGLTPAEKRLAEQSILLLFIGIESARDFQQRQGEEREEG